MGPLTPAAPTPERALSAFDASMVVVGSIVGSGIFFVSAEAAKHTGSGADFLAAWGLGGLLALAGALCNGELGGSYPRGGGEYVYLREAYGPAFGFLSGWTSFWVGFPGSIATMASMLGQATAHREWVGTIAIVALTLLNALGLRPGKWTQDALSLLKILAFASLLAVGALLGAGEPAHFSMEAPGASNLALALVPVSFAYSGWNAATYVAGEIRDPGRNLARALVWGTGASVLVYLAVNAVYLYAMPLVDLREAKNVAEAAAARLAGEPVGAALGALTAVVVLSSLQATILTGPRIYQAMAEDRLFFAPLARLHPRFRVPVVALAVQGALACALLWSGSFEALLRFTTVAILLFSTLTVAAVYVLRARRPELPRPYRTPGYPVTPAVFIAGNAWVLGNVVATGAVEAIAGLGIVAAGVPVYRWFRRRAS